MYDKVSTNHAKQIARLPKWRVWWEANKTDFKVIRTLGEEVLERIQVH